VHENIVGLVVTVEIHQWPHQKNDLREREREREIANDGAMERYVSKTKNNTPKRFLLFSFFLLVYLTQGYLTGIII